MDSNEANENIYMVLFLLAMLVLVYIFYGFPLLRGPATDMAITAHIDPNGNFSKYSLEMQFADSQSYNQFIQNLNSPGKKTIADYLSQEVTNPNDFSINNDSDKNKITISLSNSEEINKEFKNIGLVKKDSYWEYTDNSIINSSYVPKGYVNKLTYTLIIPSKIIEANTIDNSSSFFFLNETTLTWTIDENKNPLNPSGNNIPIQQIYVKFETPAQTDYTRVIMIVGGVIILFLIILYLGAKR